MTMMNLEEFKFTPENPSYPTFAYPPTPQSYRCLSFKQGIDTRDEIDGEQCCIVCGTTLSLRHAHILPPEDVAGHFIWLKLKETQEIPQWAQGVEEEPRNGLSLCATHHVAFDHYQFYIRYVPSPLDRFILLNISTHPDLSQFHGKAIFLNPAHHIVPFPSCCTYMNTVRALSTRAWTVLRYLARSFIQIGCGSPGGVCSHGSLNLKVGLCVLKMKMKTENRPDSEICVFDISV
ncbi:hypothetical protein CPB84DRAFT_197611 [Gymnopilus junonius]|uniref:HNH nuclease domain-containing protein n=1 Tax=Gymnopilus junonius TaxID=109634 RepID=A0A9P5TIW0_GYMJU|nr:hypothetical protein CPB84DRAFT_197611 [Gymnopilus junonius]